VLKLVVAYVDPDAFEPIREELLALGIPSLSVMDASGTFAEADRVGSYRGMAVERHARPKARMECLVGEAEVASVMATVRAAGDRVFAFVVPVEEAHPMAFVIDGAGEATPAA
jgi:nitrogen regulatory protein PII